jgi:high-affinity iron transporter
MFGALGGFLLAFIIGAAFIAVWFTEAADLWTKTEYLWEGMFCSMTSDVSSSG